MDNERIPDLGFTKVMLLRTNFQLQWVWYKSKSTKSTLNRQELFLAITD